VEDLVAVLAAAGGNPVRAGRVLRRGTRARGRPAGSTDRAADGLRSTVQFMRTVGVPAPMVTVMSLLPVWKNLTGIAHTLPNDYAIVLPFQQGRPLPGGHYAGVKPETLVIAGGKSPAYMRNAQAAIVEQLPRGRLLTLPGQTHLVKAKATTPALLDHFGG
jgi:hypothetical protein